MQEIGTIMHYCRMCIKLIPSFINFHVVIIKGVNTVKILKWQDLVNFGYMWLVVHAQSNVGNAVVTIRAHDCQQPRHYYY